MCMVTNYDLFEELFEFIKKDEIEVNDVLKEFGGSNYYIPSYKVNGRNEEIKQRYAELQEQGQKFIAKTVGREFELSEAQVYLITKKQR